MVKAVDLHVSPEPRFCSRCYPYEALEGIQFKKSSFLFHMRICPIRHRPRNEPSR